MALQGNSNKHTNKQKRKKQLKESDTDDEFQHLKRDNQKPQKNLSYVLEKSGSKNEQHMNKQNRKQSPESEIDDEIHIKRDQNPKKKDLKKSGSKHEDAPMENKQNLNTEDSDIELEPMDTNLGQARQKVEEILDKGHDLGEIAVKKSISSTKHAGSQIRMARDSFGDEPNDSESCANPIEIPLYPVAATKKIGAKMRMLRDSFGDEPGDSKDDNECKHDMKSVEPLDRKESSPNCESGTPKGDIEPVEKGLQKKPCITFNLTPETKGNSDCVDETSPSPSHDRVELERIDLKPIASKRKLSRLLNNAHMEIPTSTHACATSIQTKRQRSGTIKDRQFPFMCSDLPDTVYSDCRSTPTETNQSDLMQHECPKVEQPIVYLLPSSQPNFYINTSTVEPKISTAENPVANDSPHTSPKPNKATVDSLCNEDCACKERTKCGEIKHPNPQLNGFIKTNEVDVKTPTTKNHVASEQLKSKPETNTVVYFCGEECVCREALKCPENKRDDYCPNSQAASHTEIDQLKNILIQVTRKSKRRGVKHKKVNLTVNLNGLGRQHDCKQEQVPNDGKTITPVCKEDLVSKLVAGGDNKTYETRSVGVDEETIQNAQYITPRNLYENFSSKFVDSKTYETRSVDVNEETIQNAEYRTPRNLYQNLSSKFVDNKTYVTRSVGVDEETIHNARYTTPGDLYQKFSSKLVTEKATTTTATAVAQTEAATSISNTDDTSTRAYGICKPAFGYSNNKIDAEAQTETVQPPFQNNPQTLGVISSVKSLATRAYDMCKPTFGYSNNKIDTEAQTETVKSPFQNIPRSSGVISSVTSRYEETTCYSESSSCSTSQCPAAASCQSMVINDSLKTERHSTVECETCERHSCTCQYTDLIITTFNMSDLHGFGESLKSVLAGDRDCHKSEVESCVGETGSIFETGGIKERVVTQKSVSHELSDNKIHTELGGIQNTATSQKNVSFKRSDHKIEEKSSSTVFRCKQNVRIAPETIDQMHSYRNSCKLPSSGCEHESSLGNESQCSSSGDSPCLCDDTSKDSSSNILCRKYYQHNERFNKNTIEKSDCCPRKQKQLAKDNKCIRYITPSSMTETDDTIYHNTRPAYSRPRSDRHQDKKYSMTPFCREPTLQMPDVPWSISSSYGDEDSSTLDKSCNRPSTSSDSGSECEPPRYWRISDGRSTNSFNKRTHYALPTIGERQDEYVPREMINRRLQSRYLGYNEVAHKNTSRNSYYSQSYQTDDSTGTETVSSCPTKITPCPEKIIPSPEKDFETSDGSYAKSCPPSYGPYPCDEKENKIKECPGEFRAYCQDREKHQLPHKKEYLIPDVKEPTERNEPDSHLSGFRNNCEVDTIENNKVQSCDSSTTGHCAESIFDLANFGVQKVKNKPKLKSRKCRIFPELSDSNDCSRNRRRKRFCRQRFPPTDERGDEGPSDYKKMTAAFKRGLNDRCLYTCVEEVPGSPGCFIRHDNLRPAQVLVDERFRKARCKNCRESESYCMCVHHVSERKLHCDECLHSEARITREDNMQSDRSCRRRTPRDKVCFKCEPTPRNKLCSTGQSPGTPPLRSNPSRYPASLTPEARRSKQAVSVSKLPDMPSCKQYGYSDDNPCPSPNRLPDPLSRMPSTRRSNQLLSLPDLSEAERCISATIQAEALTHPLPPCLETVLGADDDDSDSDGDLKELQAHRKYFKRWMSNIWGLKQRVQHFEKALNKKAQRMLKKQLLKEKSRLEQLEQECSRNREYQVRVQKTVEKLQKGLEEGVSLTDGLDNSMMSLQSADNLKRKISTERTVSRKLSSNSSMQRLKHISSPLPENSCYRDMSINGPDDCIRYECPKAEQMSVYLLPNTPPNIYINTNTPQPKHSLVQDTTVNDKYSNNMDTNKCPVPHNCGCAMDHSEESCASINGITKNCYKSSRPVPESQDITEKQVLNSTANVTFYLPPSSPDLPDRKGMNGLYTTSEKSYCIPEIKHDLSEQRYNHASYITPHSYIPQSFSDLPEIKPDMSDRRYSHASYITPKTPLIPQSVPDLPDRTENPIKYVPTTPYIPRSNSRLPESREPHVSYATPRNSYFLQSFPDLQKRRGTQDQKLYTTPEDSYYIPESCPCLSERTNTNAPYTTTKTTYIHQSIPDLPDRREADTYTTRKTSNIAQSIPHRRETSYATLKDSQPTPYVPDRRETQAPYATYDTTQPFTTTTKYTDLPDEKRYPKQHASTSYDIREMPHEYVNKTRPDSNVDTAYTGHRTPPNPNQDLPDVRETHTPAQISSYVPQSTQNPSDIKETHAPVQKSSYVPQSTQNLSDIRETHAPVQKSSYLPQSTQNLSDITESHTQAQKSSYIPQSTQNLSDIRETHTPAQKSSYIQQSTQDLPDRRESQTNTFPKKSNKTSTIRSTFPALSGLTEYLVKDIFNIYSGEKDPPHSPERKPSGNSKVSLTNDKRYPKQHPSTSHDTRKISHKYVKKARPESNVDTGQDESEDNSNASNVDRSYKRLMHLNKAIEKYVHDLDTDIEPLKAEVPKKRSVTVKRKTASPPAKEAKRTTTVAQTGMKRLKFMKH